MNTLKEDWNSPIIKVHRWWIRIPTTLIVTIIFLPFSPLIGVYAFIAGFTIPCCKGKSK